MTRDEYELFCAGIEIAPFSDAAITTGSHRHGDYTFSDDPTGAWRLRQLASQRRESGMTLPSENHHRVDHSFL